MNEPKQKKEIVTIENLKKYFKIQDRKTVHTLKAVDDVSLSIFEGETLGIVGESGCGKSTLGKTVLHLYDKTDGKVLFHGKDLAENSADEMNILRKNVQMIFQDPFSSLNPQKKVKDLVAQPLRIHKAGSKAEINQQVESLLAEVGLNPSHKNRYPHQFSGGQRQRIGIARALALRPEFIICDEAVSALDVSIQAQIINLLLDLQEKYNFTYMFITHDRAVVEFIADRIAVMYLGKIVEIADKDELKENRMHPYTQALFDAFPNSSPEKAKKREIIEGDVPSAINPPSGCHFHPRCPHAMDICRTVSPGFTTHGSDSKHCVACHLYGDEKE